MAALLELTRQVIFLIPLYLFFPALLMQLVGVTGLQGVVISAPASDLLATVTTGAFVVREVRKLRRMRDADEQRRLADAEAGAATDVPLEDGASASVPMA